MCLYPTLIKNKKYTKTKKNGGIIPAVLDERTLYCPRKCNKCIECVKQKAREWQVRLNEHIKENKHGKFVTLTFSNEKIKEITEKIEEDTTKEIQRLTHQSKLKRNVKAIEKLKQRLTGYDLDNAIATYAVRHFLERYRKKFNKSINHWFITELGHQGTENIHLHGILWKDTFKENWLEQLNEIEEIWQYGFMWKYKKEKQQKINYVSEQTINYTIKYVTKTDNDHPNYQSIILSSDGIGKRYIQRKTGNVKNNQFNGEKTKEYYKTPQGQKLNLPIYYRNKIYTDEQREKLWIQKLNKQKRYILGKEIDISKNDKKYWTALKYARKQAQELGYRNNEANWKQKEYELEHRRLMQLTRIQKAKTTTPKHI